VGYIGRQNINGRFQKLSDISGGFNGSATAFTLQSAGVNVVPNSEQNVLISISGVIQEPGQAFTISGSTITFTGAPASSDTFFGIVLGEVNSVGTPSDSTVNASALGSGFFVKNSQTFANFSIAGSENALLVGTVTVSGTITIPSGSTLVIV
jgi:hypothetical protein|tara:strand:+ start:478 stop:933 length:456 start_codon:yes stop_codon:yes gene_type:complete